MSKNFQFQINKNTFKLSNKHIQTTDYRGNPITPKIKMGHAATASVVKQYVKLKYPEVVVLSSSSSFANGNSADIYVSDERGAEIDDKIVNDIKQFGNIFCSGTYNSWEESYEYKEYKGETDGGTLLEPNCKYLTINNNPKFVSVPDIYRMLVAMSTTTEYVFGMITMEKAIERCVSYGATEVNISKALKLF